MIFRLNEKECSTVMLVQWKKHTNTEKIDIG